ncbi:MAG: hypothetical protein KJ963_08550 [Bacteroidetes bacterium]|nr:hypothetical protein [Bacteroidota bacterium]MBU1423431.1 hypothetical protein [Bacteroidota bacterium]MBU2637116.1 hypothetical protein [Bacteroidota bacterium]
MKKNEIQDALEPVVKAFEDLGILYYISGSVASSVYGIARATMDIDLVSDCRQNQVNLLVKKLKTNYFIDENMISDAIKNNSSFNLIHLDTMLKIDVFILKERSFQKMAFERKRKDSISDEPDSVKVYFCSAEDIILSKLEWYKSGGCVSERQWKDVVGVIKVQGDLLDKAYLWYWSKDLGVDDLLEKALLEGRV